MQQILKSKEDFIQVYCNREERPAVILHSTPWNKGWGHFNFVVKSRTLAICACSLLSSKEEADFLLSSWQETILQLGAKYPLKLGSYPPKETGR